MHVGHDSINGVPQVALHEAHYAAVKVFPQLHSDSRTEKENIDPSTNDDFIQVKRKRKYVRKHQKTIASGGVVHMANDVNYHNGGSASSSKPTPTKGSPKRKRHYTRKAKAVVEGASTSVISPPIVAEGNAQSRGTMAPRGRKTR